MWQWLKDLWRGLPELGGRSSEWPKLRNQFFKANPLCAMCGKPGNEVHHQIPVSVDKSKELLWDNLLTGCSSCHLKFFHLGSYRSFCEDIKVKAAEWRKKIENRP